MSGQVPSKKTKLTRAKQKIDAVADPRLVTLLEAAESVFLAKGYHAATMDEVAKAAGMSKKTVYELIESKADLFASLLAHHKSLLKFPEPQPDWTPQDILVAHLLTLARFLLSPKQIDILRLIMAEYTHSPDFGRVFMRNRVIKAKSKLESCLSELIINHGLCAPDAKEYTAMLFGMAIGEFHLGTLIGFRASPNKQVLEARVRRAVEIFCAGCCSNAKTSE
jgi:TetR/AcrR family transcriptional regulator, mexJK operon transcriptional repressor